MIILEKLLTNMGKQSRNNVFMNLTVEVILIKIFELINIRKIIYLSFKNFNIYFRYYVIMQ